VSDFLYHEACPKCGSSDAKAVYVGGGAFCFSCRTAFPPTTSPYLFKPKVNGQETNSTTEGDGKESLTLPSGCTQEYTKETIEWVGQFDLGVAECLRRNVYSEPFRKQTIFTFWSGDGRSQLGGTEEHLREFKSKSSKGLPAHLLLYQARNHSPLSKQRYFTKGNPNDCLPIYYTDHPGRRSSVLVVVEDCLSAIKIASTSDCMPVLGSDLSPIKIKRLAGVYGAFLIWLDGNMFHKAQKIARKLQFLGCSAEAVYTDLDPKCYKHDKVLDFLQKV